MEEHKDPLASDSQHPIRMLTRNVASLENPSNTYLNGQKITYASEHFTSEHEFSTNQPSASVLLLPAPFNDDPVAVETRAKCDYSIKITKEMAASGKAPRPVRVYADGIYDLFHQGHARLLMQAKNAFPSVYLLAGVHSDVITHQNKGKTVMTEDERYEVVRHCRYVDEVVKHADWIPYDKFLEENKIDFVAHDGVPYKMGSQKDIYQHLKDNGMFVVTERTEGVSTTDLVGRIVRDYEKYIRRNLDRGYSGKNMNLSFLNEKQFLLQNKMDKIKKKIEEKKQELLYELQGKTRNCFNNFLDVLIKNSRVDFIWKGSNGGQSLSSAKTPNGNLSRRSSAPSVKSSPMDTGATRGTFKKHLTSNYVFLFAILLFSLFIHLLTNYQNKIQFSWNV